MSESEEETPEWRDPEVLERLIHDEGLTYQEIANKYSDQGASESKVGRRARELGVNPVDEYEGPVYTGNTVPVGESSGNYEHPLASHHIDEMGLEEGDLVRYMLRSVDGEIEAILDAKPAREAQQSRVYGNERQLASRPGTYHLLARYPRKVAVGIGLHERADGESRYDRRVSQDWQLGRDATVEIINQDTATVRFDPPLTAWQPSDENPSPEVAALEPKVKPLFPLRPADADLAPSTIEKYRLDMPGDYRDAYGLSGGQRIVLTIGEVAGELSIVFLVDADPEKAHPSATRRVQSYTAGQYETPDDAEPYQQAKAGEGRGTREYEFEQVGLYPGKSLLHTLGIGINETRPKVRLVPGDGWFAIQPYPEDAYGNQVEIYDPLRASTQSMDVPEIDVELEA